MMYTKLPTLIYKKLYSHCVKSGELLIGTWELKGYIVLPYFKHDR